MLIERLGAVITEGCLKYLLSQIVTGVTLCQTDKSR